MTKKDYVEASKIVGRVASSSGRETALIVASAFVALFLLENGRFDFERFMDACEKEMEA